MQLIEILSACLGLLGAVLLATRSHYAGWAFVAWFASNIGWIVFGASNQHWFFIAQQTGFTVTSLLGIWQWLVKPLQQRRAQASQVPAEPGMTAARAKAVLRLVGFPGYTFLLVGNFIGATYLQATFHASCNQSGGRPVRQTTRKWQLSAHMTPSELVQTALKCVLTSLEHEAREQFIYRGKPIFGPHFDVERLADLCEQGSSAMEVRS